MPTLEWTGKQAVVKHHTTVPFHLLREIPDRSVGDADSGNLLVQGDNLMALKALLPYYAGKVKCIYIDPPYNTGKEGWVYNDNVNSQEIREWLGKVVGKEAEDLSRHEKWLCMMYPRLLLLYQLLAEDGVMFVSIDDIELSFLRVLLDGLFRPSNRLACFVWQTEGNFDNTAKVKIAHEYILAYAKNMTRVPYPPVIDPTIEAESKLYNAEIRNTIVKNGPKNPVSGLFLPAGFPASFEKGTIPKRTDAWPHYEEDVRVEDYKLKAPVTGKSGWSSKRLCQAFIDGRFEPVLDSKKQETTFELTESGAIEAVKKRAEDQSYVISVIRGVGTTQSTSAALQKMGVRFTYPKPVRLIKYLLSMVAGDDCIVLDSFAGSGTTGHAVMQLNKEDGGNRRFILVEMEENVATTVTARRLKAVIEGHDYEGEVKTELLREKLTVTNIKYSHKIMARIDALKEAHKKDYDGFETKVEKGHLVFYGKKHVDGFRDGIGGGFRYAEIGPSLLDTTGAIRPEITYEDLARHVYFCETGRPLPEDGLASPPLIGTPNGAALYLLFDGVLQDRFPDGAPVLTRALLDRLPPFDGPKVVYGAGCRISPLRLRELGVTFKQIPYDVRVR